MHLVWVLLLLINTTSSGSPQDLFFLVHDYDCKDQRTIVSALKDAGAISSESAESVGQILDKTIDHYRTVRLATAPSVETFTVQISQPAEQPLSQLPWETRRDELIAALDLLVQQQAAATFNVARTATSVSQRFLPHTGIDIIDDSQLPNHQVFALAKTLPCLASPPERSSERFPQASPLPNDLHADQWYLRSAPEGIGAVDAWNCYNGSS